MVPERRSSSAGATSPIRSQRRERSRPRSDSACIGGRHAVPRQTHAVDLRPAPGSCGFASAPGSTPAAAIGRASAADGRYWRSTPRCHDSAGGGVAAQQQHRRWLEAGIRARSAAMKSRSARAPARARMRAPCARRCRDSATPTASGRASINACAAMPLPAGVALSCPGFGRMDQRFVVVAGEEESAAVRDPRTARARHRRARSPKTRSFARNARLQQLDQRREHEGVIVEIGVQVRAPVLVRREQPAVAPHRAADEIRRLLRVRPAIAARRTRARHAPAPRSSARSTSVRILSSRPGRTRRARAASSLRARSLETGFDVGQRQRKLAGDLARAASRLAGATPRARSSGGPVETPVRGGDGVFVRVEHRLHLIRRPDVELAFLVLAVGVEARIEASLGRAHFAHAASRRCPRVRARSAAFAGCAPRIGVKRQQRRVVVEHLFEMRNRPLGVDAVAAEAAASWSWMPPSAMRASVTATMRERVLVACRGVTAQAKVELGRVRKFRRARRNRRSTGSNDLRERRDRRARSPLAGSACGWHPARLGLGQREAQP